MPDAEAYSLTLVAYDQASGDITFTISADDVEFCEANAIANGWSPWIFTSEVIDPSRMQVVDGQLVDRPLRGPDRASMVISPRQLFLALMHEDFKFITLEEAVAAATTAAMPASVDAVVSMLPPAEAAAARVTWGRMQEVRRLDPLVGIIGATRPDMTAEAIDEFFTFAAGL